MTNMTDAINDFKRLKEEYKASHEKMIVDMDAAEDQGNLTEARRIENDWYDKWSEFYFTMTDLTE